MGEGTAGGLMTERAKSSTNREIVGTPGSGDSRRTALAALFLVRAPLLTAAVAAR